MGARRKDWIDRALEQAASSVIAQGKAAALLAQAPVKAQPTTYLPLNTNGAQVIRVTHEPVDTTDRTHGDDLTRELHAGMRATLTDALEWGRERVRVAALLDDNGLLRTVVLEGRESAIAASFPDATTLQAWLTAGAIAMPVVVGEHPTFPGRNEVRWVPAAWAPRVVQMERLGRPVDWI